MANECQFISHTIMEEMDEVIAAEAAQLDQAHRASKRKNLDLSSDPTPKQPELSPEFLFHQIQNLSNVILELKASINELRKERAEPTPKHPELSPEFLFKQLQILSDSVVALNGSINGLHKDRGEEKTATRQPTLPTKPSRPVETPQWKTVTGKPRNNPSKSQHPVQPTKPLQPPVEPVPQKISYANALTKSSTILGLVRNATNEGDVVAALAVKPVPVEDRVETIRSRYFSFNLSQKARQAPLAAWWTMVRSVCGDAVLSISLLNPGQAQIFFADRNEERILKLRQYATELPIHVTINASATEVGRLAHAYLRGYFRPLRLAVLAEFPLELRTRILERALNLIPKVYQESSSKRSLWKHNVKTDQQVPL
jgi:hypothetical protein